jgi:hypothetical protein
MKPSRIFEFPQTHLIVSKIIFYISLLEMDVGSDNFRFTLDDPELKARTMRWPKTSELHLDSLDRYTLSTVPYVTTLNGGGSQNDAKLLGPLYSTAFLPATNNCVIQTKRNLIYGYMSRIALTQMNLSYRVPTVTASTTNFIGNNTIGVVVNGSPPRVCTITPGFYTSEGLATAFQSALRNTDALLNAATVTPVSSQTVGFAAAIQTGYIVNSGSASVFISFTRLNTSTATLANSTRAFRLLGINTGGTWGSQVASQLTTLGVPNLLPTDYVDVVSQALTNYKDTKDANSSVQSPGSVLGRIWLTEDSSINGQTATNGYPDPNLLGAAPMNFYKTWYNPNWSQWSPNQAINTVDVTLLDMWGQPLFWSPTYQTEWSATVTVTE